VIALRQDRDPDKPFVEAFREAGVRYYAKRLREREAGKVTAAPYDPLAAMERREKARQERHMGSVVRRLHRQGKLTLGQLEALERWAHDHAAATVGVRSQLGRDGTAGGGDGTVDPERARALALSRFNVARAALYVGAGLEAGRVTEAVACRNASIAGVVVSVMGKSKGGRSSAEALDMLKGGADALERHYRGRETR
jgi:hypothetical protein